MEFQSRIEEELRCPNCSELYVDAILLSCSHSVCLQCALTLSLANDSSQAFAGKSSAIKSGCYDSLTVPGPSPVPADDGGGASKSGESDRSSVGSEADSGVICSAPGATTPSAATNSRPSSFVGPSDNARTTPSVGNLSTASSQDSGSSGSSAHAQICCPRCHRATTVEDSTVSGIAGSLPRNGCLEAIVDRYRESRAIPIACQRCGKDGDDPEKVFYSFNLI